MKQVIFILFSVAFLVLGCHKKTEVSDGSIRFIASQPASGGSAGASMTKVTGTSFDEGEFIAVFAPLAGKVINENDSYINGDLPWARNKKYVADASNNFNAINESNTIRYQSSTQLDFYAVYPFSYKSKGVIIGSETSYVVDLGSIKEQSAANAEDRLPPYMYSNNAKGLSSENGVVNLVFRYVFSKVNISVSYIPASMEGVLSKVEMYASDGMYHDCVIDLKLNDYKKLATCTDKNDSDYKAVASNPYIFWTPAITSNPSGEIATEGYLLPSAVTDPIIMLTFDIPEKDDKVATTKVYHAKVPTSGGGGLTYVAGEQYGYKITINDYGGDIVLESVTITASIAPWTVVGAPPTIDATIQ